MGKPDDDAVLNRLDELRQRVRHGTRNAKFNKDLEHITSDLKSDIQIRTFFVGEIFWVEREGWKGCGGFYSNTAKEHHPGLVTRKTHSPYSPVDMVPGSSSEEARYWNQQQCIYFDPQEAIKLTYERDTPETQYYVLDYHRPVARDYMSGHLGNLRFGDIQRLQQALRKTPPTPTEAA